MEDKKSGAKILVRALLLFPRNKELSDRLKTECRAFWDRKSFIWTVELKHVKRACEIAAEYGLTPTDNFVQYWDAFKAEKARVEKIKAGSEDAKLPGENEDADAPF